MTRPNWLRAAALTTISLVLPSLAPAQDEKPKAKAEETRTITVEGVSFETPKTWKLRSPANAMQKQVLEVAPAEGDDQPAKLVLYVFPGGAGTVEANVERWQNQFKDEDGQTPEIETKKVKGQGVEVTRAEVAGTFKDPFAPGGPYDDYRLFGAILTTKTSGYFFKMVGPEKTMKKAEAAFDKLIASLKIAE